MAHAFVIRSDVGVRPAWLKSIRCQPDDYWHHDLTEDPREACAYWRLDDAQMYADQWSDFPGVWRVVVRQINLST